MIKLTLSQLRTQHCKVYPQGSHPLNESQIGELLTGLPEWTQVDSEIARSFRFQNFHEVMAFVNAVAWIAHQENHHPEMEIGFRTCRVRYTTHTANGLSPNDFICALRVDALLDSFV